MADSAAVDAALVGRLAADAPLKALLPHGVHLNIAARGATAFVLVAPLAHQDEAILEGQTGWEVFTYAVKAVIASPSGTTADAGAARIKVLLQNTALGATNYGDLHCQRTERIHETEVDEVSNVVWQHRGGLYEIWVQPQD